MSLTIGVHHHILPGYPSGESLMVVVGLDYGHAGQMTLDEITGGPPYGATTIAGGDGSRLPTANELQGARYQGRKIAETANKLHG
jgi:NAD(P)H dehydrogenase (quinone)